VAALRIKPFPPSVAQPGSVVMRLQPAGTCDGIIYDAPFVAAAVDDVL